MIDDDAVKFAERLDLLQVYGFDPIDIALSLTILLAEAVGVDPREAVKGDASGRMAALLESGGLCVIDRRVRRTLHAHLALGSHVTEVNDDTTLDRIAALTAGSICIFLRHCLEDLEALAQTIRRPHTGEGAYEITLI